jgi:hypothetical protein
MVCATELVLTFPLVPDPPPTRSKAPSLSELWTEVTESHRLESDPPGARWLDRRIGRAVRLGLRWLCRTKTGTAFAACCGAAATWLSHHWLHWIR